jgi:hypothetical protein
MLLKGFLTSALTVKRNVYQQEMFFIPSGLEHGVICIEAGELVDVFNPAREDFIN